MIMIIFLSIGVILFALGLFIMLRNNAVFRFRSLLINQCTSYNYRLNVSDMTEYEEKNAWNIYYKLPSYHDMVYSFKPLRPKYWLSKEDYDTLFPETIISE